MVRNGVIFSNSIDSFIDVHVENKKVQFTGKLAIAKAILDAERNSYLYIEEPNGDFSDLTNLKNTWYFDFARNLNDGVRKNEIDRIFEKASFVIFNYDRCFEHFMYNVLQRLYGVEAKTAQSVMKHMRVFHPYGTIGDLNWQNEDKGIPFGFRANRANMEFMVSRIKTYTERVEETNMITAIRREISTADTLVFLGFSYHNENMKILNPGKVCSTKQVYGTALGISSSNKEDVMEEIRKLVGKSLREQRLRDGTSSFVWEPIHNELKCSGLLREYTRSLFVAGRDN